MRLLHLRDPRDRVHWPFEMRHNDFAMVKKLRNLLLTTRMSQICTVNGRSLFLLSRPLDTGTSWWNHKELAPEKKDSRARVRLSLAYPFLCVTPRSVDRPHP